MSSKNYAPGAVVVNINGTQLVSWNNVNADYNEDRWTPSSATTGETTQTRNESKLGTITITLPQTSADNKVLDNLLAEQNKVAADAGSTTEPDFVNVSVTDLWGKNLHDSSEARMVKKPKAEYGKEPTDKEWAFVGDLDNAKNGSDT